MKKLGVFLYMCWLVCAWVMADDASLVRIDGREVRLSEFLWYFQRTGEKDVNGYFNRFLTYRLKVADAKYRRLDTLPDFRRQSDFLQARVLKKHFMNHQLADSCYQGLKGNLSLHRTEKEWVRTDVFTYRLSQHASNQEEANAVRVMNEWGKLLNQVGTPTDDQWTQAVSRGVVRQLEAGQWIPVNGLLKEFISQMESVEMGTWTKPFYSPLGLHVLRLVEKRADVADEWRADLERYLEREGIASPLLNRKAYEEWTQGNYQLPDEVQYEMNQVHDGLLVAYWEQQQQVMAPEAHAESEQLESYFRSHKKDYRWEFPHYKGAVVHCMNKKAASKIKKHLKKIPMELWEEAFRKLQQENVDYRGEIECGLFQIGKNPYVDRLAFKCGHFEPNKAFPYTFLLGKKLKKGPETYTDILPRVTSDYFRQRENDRISRLFARFNVEINEDVLKTVNSCGNK